MEQEQEQQARFRRQNDPELEGILYFSQTPGGTEKQRQSLNKRRRKRSPKPSQLLPDLPEKLTNTSYQFIHAELGSDLEQLFDVDDSFKERRKIIRRAINKNAEFKEWIQQSFAEELKRDGDRWAKGWMYDSKKINNRLKDEKDKLNKAIKIWNYLWKKRLSHLESEELAKRIGAGGYKMTKKTQTGQREITRPYVFIGQLDFKEMGKDVKMSRSAIRQYMLASVKEGILKRFRKSGPRAQIVYAMGWFLPRAGTSPRGIPFLTKDNSKEAFDAFLNQ